jgi:ABC-type nitrate/sulfonate/bicarbonate transport system substrate-binding protein
MMSEDDLRKYLMIIITSEAATFCSALENIKRGRLNYATELLEAGLDRCVMCLDQARKKAQPDDRKALTGSLSAARTYRRRHPRHAKADASSADPTDSQEIARKILEELEE